MTVDIENAIVSLSLTKNINMINKIILGVFGAAVLAVGAYLLINNTLDPKQPNISGPEDIVADYEDLLVEAEDLKLAAGSDCANKKDVNQKIDDLENKLNDLGDRKKDWLDNVPKLPEINPETIITDDPRGRPGSEVPELGSDVPALPDIDPDSMVIIPGRPGSESPELSSDVPPLPDIKIKVIDPEYIPEMPEINTGRPGSEIPELTSNVPPLPEIDDWDIVDPDEPIIKMTDLEQKIASILQDLKVLCKEDDTKKKVISDKCSDTCQRHKDCAGYTEDVTAVDLNDAYTTCMEECVTWPKEMIKCINAVDIKKPNDCVSFVKCQLPQFYEENYLN